MISKDVVESLSLPTWEHPKPYYMQWINGVGKLKVTHRVKVPFAVEGYTDKVECDVLPLHVCHLLLGRPWQHDVNALHHGRTNRYTFMHKGEFYTLLPKEDKDINCTIEVFKKKAARRRLKPRTVSLQGREDDEALSSNSTALHATEKQPRVGIVSQRDMAKYIVPARREMKRAHAILVHTNIGMAPKIAPPEEVKPTFRTPCTYIMVGQIAIKI
jgi:hypothetical protein